MKEFLSIGKDASKFYEDAWAARLMLFHQWISEGAKNPYGIIRKLE